MLVNVAKSSDRVPSVHREHISGTGSTIELVQHLLSPLISKTFRDWQISEDLN